MRYYLQVAAEANSMGFFFKRDKQNKKTETNASEAKTSESEVQRLKKELFAAAKSSSSNTKKVNKELKKNENDVAYFIYMATGGDRRK